MLLHGALHKEYLFWRRLQAELQSAQAHAEEVERSMRAQLTGALGRLTALEAEPLQALAERLANAQASAKGVTERCERLEVELAVAHG